MLGTRAKWRRVVFRLGHFFFSFSRGRLFAALVATVGEIGRELTAYCHWRGGEREGESTRRQEYHST